MIKQEIRALFLAHGFKLEQQPDGSTDLNPACYSVAQALAEQFSDIYGQPGRQCRDRRWWWHRGPHNGTVSR